MTSDNEQAIEALNRLMDDLMAAKLISPAKNDDAHLIRTALQRDDSVVEEMVEALKEIANIKDYHGQRQTATEALSKFNASRGKK